MHLTLLAALSLYFASMVPAEQNAYRAAVLEYPPITDGPTALEDWDNNLKEILHFIRDAANQKAQIIVLPEDALSGLAINFHELDGLSTSIPEAKHQISPCVSYRESNLSSTLRDLSCAAQNHKIYVVVNLIEKVIDPSGSAPIYHNTNVVFNRNGEIVARYRKINLFNEAIYGNGNELVTFTTDFGVTFGMLICFDIVFKMPSMALLSINNVTDIVFSSAWFSFLPFYQSLSIQHGYAKASGINLLAAGMSDPSGTSGGSGIYLADGRIAETFLSGKPLSQLIVRDVPRISSKIPNSSCELQRTSGLYEWGVDHTKGNISDFQTIQEDLSHYTFKSLNLVNESEIFETICSGTSNYCCTFNISISRTHDIQPTYTYKLAAFQGTWQPSRAGTVGVRNCAIVACLNESTSTCGARKAIAPKGITFEKISVKASVEDGESKYQPATVTFDLKPASDYTFCAHKSDRSIIDISMMTTTSHDNLLTFGVVGRVFRYDNLPVGPVNNGVQNKLNIIMAFFVGIICLRNLEDAVSKTN